MSSQKTRHQKLNSYWVMNSLGDNLSTQQRYPLQSIKYKNMYASIQIYDILLMASPTVIVIDNKTSRAPFCF